jgi:UDP-glucose 6-dehydrogenase
MRITVIGAGYLGAVHAACMATAELVKVAANSFLATKISYDNARAAFPSFDYALEPAKACEGADLVLHLTEWPQYRELDPAQLAAVTATPRILDARNALDLDRWRSAGWTARALGRPARAGR